MKNIIFNKLYQYLLLDNLNPNEKLSKFLKDNTINRFFSSPIIGNIIISDGDVYNTLKVINDLAFLKGNFLLLTKGNINDYFIKRANNIYQDLNLNVSLELKNIEDYSLYLDSYLTIIGNEEFVLRIKDSFKYSNYIIT